VYYRLAEDLPLWASESIKQFATAAANGIQPLLANLNAMGDRPVREQLCCN